MIRFFHYYLVLLGELGRSDLAILDSKQSSVAHHLGTIPFCPAANYGVQVEKQVPLLFKPVNISSKTQD